MLLRGLDDTWIRARAARANARAALLTGDLAGAERGLTRAATWAPNDWAVQRDLAVVLLRAGHRRDARVAIRRALALNPRLELPPGFVLRPRDR